MFAFCFFSGTSQCQALLICLTLSRPNALPYYIEWAVVKIDGPQLSNGFC